MQCQWLLSTYLKKRIGLDPVPVAVRLLQLEWMSGKLVPDLMQVAVVGRAAEQGIGQDPVGCVNSLKVGK